jgi:hypothetical protein
MTLDPQRIATRDKLILAGLYLSKYDALALSRLGFETFTEAFNTIGYALASQPASIKNYRDEFDPLFPNGRKGWHKRPIRAHCLKVFEEYKSLDIDSFAGLIESFVGYDENIPSDTGVVERRGSAFADRLVTGLAAERYFEDVLPHLPEFAGYAPENTTRIGCGYDFQLRAETDSEFLAVEVKGLRQRTGGLSMTAKEYEVAGAMRERFFLFVVKNFREAPFHEIFRDPLFGNLRFTRSEKLVVQVSWLATV